MKRLLAILLCLAGAAALAQSLEILTLRHRPAEQLLPELLPLLEPGAALSGRGDKLFLRTSAKNRAEILRVLEALDRAPRRLLITVRQEGTQISESRGAELSGDLRLGPNVRIIQPATGIGGASVEMRREAGALRGRVYDSRGSRSGEVSQQVQAVEGGRAYISVGQSMPLAFRQIYLSPRGPVVSEQLVYRDIGTGFYAEPRLVGDRVEIAISPSQETPLGADGGAHIERLSTTVAGRLGEWISLGGASRDSGDEQAGTLRYGTRSRSDGRQVWLRVEELP